jgi:hypothetical protein
MKGRAGSGFDRRLQPGTLETPGRLQDAKGNRCLLPAEGLRLLPGRRPVGGRQFVITLWSADTMVEIKWAIAATVVLANGLALAAEPKDIPLPKDPKAAVITLDYRGGFTPPRRSEDPYLVIRADGSVIVTDPFGQQKTVETRLAAKDLQALLRFAIVDNNFFGFDAAKVAAAVKAEQAKKGPGLAIADAATTIIRISADGKANEAKYYALGMAANQYPAVKELGQLRAIEQKLMAVMKDARAAK